MGNVPVPVVVGAVLLVNLPFGFWRAGVRKFSLPWFLAVHLPVPLAVGMRVAAGVGWQLRTVPLFVAAFFGGQLLGARLRRRRETAPGSRPVNPAEAGSSRVNGRDG